MRQIADLQRKLLAKADCERAWTAQPDDPAAGEAYLDSLDVLCAQRTGLVHAVLPVLGHALYLRAGTRDAAALRRALDPERLAWLPDAAPRRIAYLGAHAGYRAALIAARYPDAAMLCVEPDADTHRLLALNMMVHPRVHLSSRAAWHTQARLGALEIDPRSATARLGDRLPPGARTVPAAPVGTLLAEAGLPDADMLICDIAGGEAAVFADPAAPWLARVDVAAVDVDETAQPGARALVEACFPPARFERGQHGATTVFRRPGARATMPVRLALLHSAPGLIGFRLQDVAPDGFMIFDGGSCRLRPNPPGGPPAVLRVRRTLSGHTHLAAVVRHGGGGTIRVAATVASADGAPVAHMARMLSAGEEARLELAFPAPLHGPHVVSLEGAMAPGTAHSQDAAAHFLAPVLL